MFKKILVAFDGSEPARHAFHTALEMAIPFESSILVLSVAQIPEPAAMVEISAMLEAATEHYERDFASLREAAEAADVPLETRVVAGHVAEQIVHHATEEQAELIVMGHRGKSRIKEWLLGSVSKRVISYAACSVLIVR